MAHRVRTLRFMVEIDISTEASQDEVRGYIKDAVTSWGGGGHPDDPFFGLDDADVRFKRLVQPRPQKTEAA